MQNKQSKFKADEFYLGSPTSLPWPLLGDLADIYLEPENEKIHLVDDNNIFYLQRKGGEITTS